MNKPVYLALSILKIRKIVMYEFWYDYVKSKHGEKSIYMDANSFIVYIKTEDNQSDIANDVETVFDTPSYELDKQLP